MRRPSPSQGPSGGGSELERSLLDAARQDRIPRELEQRMARALTGTGTAPSAAAHGGSQVAGVGAAWSVKAGLWGALVLVCLAGGYALFWQTRVAPVAEPHAPTPRYADVAGEPHAPVTDVPPAVQLGAGSAALSEPATAQSVVPVAPVGLRALRVPARPAGAVSARQLATVRAPSLQAELALLDRARSALRTGALDEARGLLEQHAQQYTRGVFGPEAESLRIELWAQRGEAAQATRAAQRFLKRYPSHPLAVRVARLAN